jgi:hypothetical protein
MEDQELQNLWKQASPKESIQIESSTLTSSLDANLRRFNKEISKRNLRETLGGLFVLITFSAIAYLVPGLLAKTGSALCAAYGLMIIFVVNKMKAHKEEDYALTLKEYLLSQRVHLLKERKLLNTVLYWYILPPTIAVLLFFAGLHLPNLAFISFSLLVAGINTGILFINKNTIKKTVDPLLLQLNKSISQLEPQN